MKNVKGEIIKEVNSVNWTLQLYDDKGYHSSVYAPKKSDLTQYMRKHEISKFSKSRIGYFLLRMRYKLELLLTNKNK